MLPPKKTRPAALGSKAPAAKPVSPGRALPPSKQKGRRRTWQPIVEVELKAIVAEIVGTLKALRKRGQKLDVPSQQHRRETVIQALLTARRIRRTPKLFAAYRALAPGLGVVRPPKTEKDLYRVIVQEAYYPPKSASWASQATELFWNAEDIDEDEVGRLIREHGIGRAAVMAGLKEDPQAPSKELPRAPAGKPFAVAVPTGKPMSAAGMPSLQQVERASAAPAAKPRPVRKEILADIVYEEEEQTIRFRLKGNKKVLPGSVIEVRVSHIEGAFPSQTGSGTWTLIG